ncbi:putative histone hairpin-binding protein [Cryptosporidium felis]|nr:putative histone hairpin-binding protein [Cryptosporidium felis]
MVNTSCGKATVSKTGWGAVRWADLSISDASNSWLHTQGDTKNESKSTGLTSLLQKSIKLNESLNDFSKVDKSALNETNPNKGEVGGFLAINKLVSNEDNDVEKPDISLRNSKNERFGCRGTEKSQSLEDLEFKFGEKYPNSVVGNDQTDQTARYLIQGANLNSPKVFGDLYHITKNDIEYSGSKNKKRNKKYLYESNENENNHNHVAQSTRNQTYKKMKQSSSSTGTMKTPDLTQELKVFMQLNPDKSPLEENTQINKFDTSNEPRNNSTKFSSSGTPEMPQLKHDKNKNATDKSSSSNIDWSKRISSRLFQIAIGKGTRAYQNFLKLKPKKEDREPSDPQTPNAHSRCPQKQFTDRLNQWRKSLHQYDELEMNISELL